jgi:putative Mg2+ transporter-C (MgtC) family protein
MNLYADLSLRLLAALAAGAVIGLERTYHSRPAGFRTYALVSLGSALMMVLGADAFGNGVDASAAASRIAQGVVTGIGFLGAGVIFKEGLNIHGLTSAASIWTTAAIGLLFGVGFWFPALLGLGAVLVTLSVLRWTEDRLPRFVFFEQVLQFERDDAPDPDQVRALLKEFGFRSGRVRQQLDAASSLIEYRVSCYTQSPRAGEALAARLMSTPAVKGFKILPTDD